MKKQFKTIILGGLLTLIITLSYMSGVNENGLATNSETGLNNKKQNGEYKGKIIMNNRIQGKKMWN